MSKSGKRKAFPFVKNWMLGRGILMNPLLPEEIAGKTITFGDKMRRLESFYGQLLEAYSGYVSGTGHLLIKLKQFWEYFSHSFPQPAKTWKSIRKSHKFNDYQAATRLIFRTRDQD